MKIETKPRRQTSRSTRNNNVDHESPLKSSSSTGSLIVKKSDSNDSLSKNQKDKNEGKVTTKRHRKGKEGIAQTVKCVCKKAVELGIYLILLSFLFFFLLKKN